MEVKVIIKFDGEFVGAIIEQAELGTDLSEMGEQLKEVLKFRQNEKLETLKILNSLHELKPTAHVCEENQTQSNKVKLTITKDGGWYIMNGSDGFPITHCPFCGEKLE